jgi:rubrerythrin
MADYKTLEKYVAYIESAQRRRLSTYTLTDLDKLVYNAFPEIAERQRERVKATHAACDRLEAYAIRRLHELTKAQASDECPVCGGHGLKIKHQYQCRLCWNIWSINK